MYGYWMVIGYSVYGDSMMTTWWDGECMVSVYCMYGECGEWIVSG